MVIISCLRIWWKSDFGRFRFFSFGNEDDRRNEENYADDAAAAEANEENSSSVGDDGDRTLQVYIGIGVIGGIRIRANILRHILISKLFTT